MQDLHIKGARQHNLKNVELTLPRNKLIVITGVSGSGKSSLALDTIYAEGQRRYVESLSAYARQFLELMDKPDVDSIDGLSPAISIEQKSVSKNPRSTVATVTEIYDYLRLLFARVGEVFCYNCNRPIRSQTVQQMCDQILGLGNDNAIHVLSPIVRGRKGEYEKDLEALRRQGYTRVIVDGKTYSLEEKIALDKKKAHSISVFVDRLVLKEGIRNRLTDSLETALRLSEGLVSIELLKKNSGGKFEKTEEFVFSERFACPHCNVSYAEISPRLFSFNSPFGACSECNGLGTRRYFDPELIVPNAKLTVRDGAIAPWAHRQTVTFFALLEAVAEHFKFSLRVPYEKLPKAAKDVLLYGVEEEIISLREEVRGRFVERKVGFTGIIPYLERKLEESHAESELNEIEKYMGETDCPTCKGSRLKKEALFIRVNNLNIAEVTALAIGKATEFFATLQLAEKEATIAKQILKEIRDRLGFLKDVGLEYLSLDRKSGTLSGGEGQRIRLATQIGSRLVGVLYILDEPSIGLHQRDNGKLLNTLHSLRDLGNTVIVVEHDEETMRAADFIVDLGPGAGTHGGNIVASGTPDAIIKNPASLTGAYLSGRRTVVSTARPRRAAGDRWLSIKGASSNNLKNIDVKFPIGLFTCITGVSGSGKSTLVIDTMYRLLMQHFFDSKERAGQVKSFEGLKYLDKVVDIDQSPIGRTPRSNPATYTGLFSHIRDLFAMLPESKARGYGAGRYSFNVKGGRCEACSGDGIIKIEMHFLPDVYVRCDACQGKRYNRETLEVVYRGKNITQVLEMTVEEALEFFNSIPAIRQKLDTLKEVGLNYISLGQAATTLSGGEAQRIKLAKELSRRATGRTLYILDEPTTGLHFEDIRNLLNVIQQLADGGNTIIVIEHNLDMIRAADYVVDLGPEGGDKGGEVVACGTPDEIMQIEASYTGKFLRLTNRDKLSEKDRADSLYVSSR